jgi:pimeloyl-ACP methyl ester carboxylesterase
MPIRTVRTSTLHLAYEEDGPSKGDPVVLVHGWPDSPRTWDKVLPSLHEAGYRTIAPYLRGYGPSRFRDPWLGRKPRRTGQPVAYGQDLIEMADRLQLRSFHCVGHDWGAWAGYVAAALFPRRLRSHVALGVPFKSGEATLPPFPQAQAFWYQWLLCTKPGERSFRKDPVAYGRAQWDAWSPKGWYDEAEFQSAAKSWTGRDFPDVVLQAYRSQWGHAERDPRYARLQARFQATEVLDVPTTLVHGREDRCELLETTDGAERHFSSGYTRVVLDGVVTFRRERIQGRWRRPFWRT